MTTPNPQLAARIRDEITENPDHHDQAAWLDGDVEVLHPEESLTSPDHCGTTLCVAGYAAHLTGHTILLSGTAVLAGPNPYRRHVEAVAREALGLTDSDAEWLFHPGRTRKEVLAALTQLADGAARLDTEAAVTPQAG